MNNYLLETHSHTSEVSPCAYLNAEKTISAYIAEGYNGIVITNHLSANTFKYMSHSSWSEKVDYFLNGYRKAKRFASDSFSVYLGFEISFFNDPNDYLVYGADEGFLLKHESIHDLNLKEFKSLAEESNLLVFQAHPFRSGMRITDYRNLDGIEVYNGNSSHNSNNDIALLWAETHKLRKISGSDFHYYFGMHPGGIILRQEIKTNAELVKVLRNGEYKLK